MKHNLILEDDERDRFDSVFNDPMVPRDYSGSLGWYAALEPGNSASGGLFVLPPRAEPDVAPSAPDFILSMPDSGTESTPSDLLELIGHSRPIAYIVTTGNSTTTVYEDGTSETVTHLLGPSGPPPPADGGAQDLAIGSDQTVGTGDNAYTPIQTGPDPIEEVTAQPVVRSIQAKATPGDDLLHGTAENDVIAGLAGNDIIHGMDGADVIRGGAGNDKLYGADGNDEIYGGAGNDSLHGGSGDDILRGGAGDDWVKGYDGDDIVRGGAGNDTLFGGAGDDQMRGGAGSDTALYFGHSSEYSLRWDGDVLLVSHDIDTFTGPTDGVDQLVGVEFIQFSDKTITVSDLETTLTRDTENEAIIEFAGGDNGLLDLSGGSTISGGTIVDGATTGNSSWIEYEDGTREYFVHLLGPSGPPTAPLALGDVLDTPDIFGDTSTQAGASAEKSADLPRIDFMPAPTLPIEDVETIIPDALA